MLGGIGDPETYYPNMWAWAVKFLDIDSVVDVGCGHGYATKYFTDIGCRAVGVEGHEDAIENSCCPSLITYHDYTTGDQPCSTSYDLAWCCEFLEHVEEQYLDNVFSTFAGAEYVFITHAVPGQGGHHHVNEQPKEYWVEQFVSRNFELDTTLTGLARLVAAADKKLLNLKNDSYFMKTGLVFRNKDV